MPIRLNGLQCVIKRAQERKLYTNAIVVVFHFVSNHAFCEKTPLAGHRNAFKNPLSSG